jgi:hypothetical protein
MTVWQDLGDGAALTGDVDCSSACTLLTALLLLLSVARVICTLRRRSLHDCEVGSNLLLLCRWHRRRGGTVLVWQLKDCCLQVLEHCARSQARARFCCTPCDQLPEEDADAEYGSAGKAGVRCVGKRSDPSSDCVDGEALEGPTSYAMRSARAERLSPASHSRCSVAALDVRLCG